MTQKYGYAYTNMFGDRILIGIFSSKIAAKSYQEKRLFSNKNPEIKDLYPRIVKWNKDIVKNQSFPYIYILRPYGSSHVVKEFDKHEDYIPCNWEMM